MAAFHLHLMHNWDQCCWANSKVFSQQQRKDQFTQQHTEFVHVNLSPSMGILIFLLFISFPLSSSCFLELISHGYHSQRFLKFPDFSLTNENFPVFQIKRRFSGQWPDKEGFLTREMTYKCYVKYNKKNEKHCHVVLVIPQMVYMTPPWKN